MLTGTRRTQHSVHAAHERSSSQQQHLPLLHGPVRVVYGDPLRGGQAQAHLLLGSLAVVQPVVDLAATLLAHLQRQCRWGSGSARHVSMLGWMLLNGNMRADRHTLLSTVRTVALLGPSLACGLEAGSQCHRTHLLWEMQNNMFGANHQRCDA
jgi:hypothetical protein